MKLCKRYVSNYPSILKRIFEKGDMLTVLFDQSALDSSFDRGFNIHTLGQHMKGCQQSSKGPSTTPLWYNT